ncbi:MAG: hypothetical protein ACP5E3_17830, partial [Bacteroidales bacterium]
GLTEEEKRYIIENRQNKDESQPDKKLTGGILFSSKNVWLAMLQYFGSNFTFFFCLTWLFPHLHEKYNLDLMEAGFYASAPLIFGA